MPRVCVHGPAATAGRVWRRGAHAPWGATVLELLRELERAYPGWRGWIVDERGLIRPHINVFVNGERGGERTEVATDARVEICPRSREGEAMTELLVATRKGLFVLAGEPGGGVGDPSRGRSRANRRLRGARSRAPAASWQR